MITLRRLALVAFAVLAGTVARADMGAAKRFYDQAKAAKEPKQQVELLKKSIAAEPTFEAYLALGDAQNTQKAWGDARESLKQALELAANDKARARATYVIAETFLGEGHRADAVALFRRSIEYHPYPNVIERLKEIELKAASAPVPAQEIAGALTSTATRSFHVEAAAIDLRIGFALGSAQLDPKGREQAQELGQALSGPAFSGKSFEIVGHTDKQGDEAYNQKLSERRAEAVRALLVQDFKIAAARLTAKGKGESQLLFPGDAESDHALNRRVEVRVQ
jgi:outer membrane protein OmpA-like peptidoglycan-associated protein